MASAAITDSHERFAYPNDHQSCTRLTTECACRADEAARPSDVDVVHGSSTFPAVLALDDEKAVLTGAAGHIRTLDEDITALSELRLVTNEAVDSAHVVVPGDTRAVSQSTSPVSRLPPELLAYIMELATLRHLPWNMTHWIHVALREWLPTVHDLGLSIVLSHVCHAWRHLATNTASLWTALRFEDVGPQVLPNRVLLVRTNAALLTVYAEAVLTHGLPTSQIPPVTSSDPLVQYTGIAHGLMSRVQHSWITHAGPLGSLNAPFLESLHVCPPAYAEAIDLPKHAPKMRTLSLDDVDCRGDQLQSLMTYPLLAQLTRLAIAFHGIYSQSQEDITHILGIIESAPMLTDLAIRNRTRTDDWDEWATDFPVLRAPIILPQLEHLTLIGDQIVMVAVLNNMRLPDQLELWLQPEDGPDPWTDYPELEMQTLYVKRHLSHAAHKPSKLRIAPLELSREYDWMYNSIYAQFFCMDGRRTLVIPVQASIYKRFPWLEDLVAAIPWDTITEMHLYMATMELSSACSFETMLQAPCLEVLHVDASAVAEVTKAVHIYGPPVPFLPALHTLVALGVRVGDLQVLLQARENASLTGSQLNRLVLGRSELRNLDKVEAGIVESWRLCIEHVQVVDDDHCGLYS
jgi:hypothetical protein